jgi:hypothetical protein
VPLLLLSFHLFFSLGKKSHSWVPPIATAYKADVVVSIRELPTPSSSSDQSNGIMFLSFVFRWLNESHALPDGIMFLPIFGFFYAAVS